MNAFPELSSFGALTPWGLILVILASFFVSLNLGRLYTKGQHDQIVALYKEALAEAKATSAKWETVAENRKEQLDLVLPQLQIVGDFFQKADRTGHSTPTAGDNEGVEGGPHVRT